MKSKADVILTSAETVLGLQSQNFKGFQNKACEFWPCHPEEEMDGMGCLSCYCPLYFLKCPGTYTRLPDGRKDCSGCTLIHRKGGWEIVQQYFSDRPRPDKFISLVPDEPSSD
jgi:Zn-finger protein